MTTKIEAIIQTGIITLLLCGLWQMLERRIYGEVQPRIVDDIMVLFFIPFIYCSCRYSKSKLSPAKRCLTMVFRKVFRIPVVMIILLIHGINPFRDLVDILPMIRQCLTDSEKIYIINTCVSKEASEMLRDMIYQ